MSKSETFFSSEQEMALRIAELEALLVKKDEKLKNYESQMSWLTEQLKTLKRNQFGTKSERWESQEQLKFNEAEVESQSPIPEKDDYTVEVRGHTKKVRGHNALPALWVEVKNKVEQKDVDTSESSEEVA